MELFVLFLSKSITFYHSSTAFSTRIKHKGQEYQIDLVDTAGQVYTIDIVTIEQNQVHQSHAFCLLDVPVHLEFLAS